MKKLLLKSALVVTTLLAAFSFNSCISLQSTAPTKVVRYDYSYNNPTWAPPYYGGARYYYFPDIEVYYDLSTRNFIMLNTGRWLYVQSIAPFYSGFDLHNSYIVILNTTVYQPWMHHHHYVKSYPRYYYIDYYDYSNIPYVRGYNENQKGAIFWSDSDRNRARPWDDRNVRSNRQFTYSSADRKVQQETTRRVNQERATATTRANTPDRSTATTTGSRTTTDNRGTATTTQPTRTTTTERGSTATRTEATTTTRTSVNDRTNIQSSTPTRSSTEARERSTSTNYYGGSIGQPVRVEPQMRRSETTTRSTTTTRGTSTTTTRENSGAATRSTSTERSNTTRTGGGR